jgi:hypothetical protein
MKLTACCCARALEPTQPFRLCDVEIIFDPAGQNVKQVAESCSPRVSNRGVLVFLNCIPASFDALLAGVRAADTGQPVRDC